MRELRGTMTELHWLERIVRGSGKLNVINFSLWTAVLEVIFDTITPTCYHLTFSFNAHPPLSTWHPPGSLTAVAMHYSPAGSKQINN